LPIRKTGALKGFALHGVDATGLVHALLLRIQALLAADQDAGAERPLTVSRGRAMSVLRNLVVATVIAAGSLIDGALT